MRGLDRWCGVLCVVALAVLLPAELFIRARAAAHFVPAATRATANPNTTGSSANNNPDFSDSYADGTPDFLRLHDSADRDSFRAWFALIAESQYYRHGGLPAEIKDCAALLRFSYHEALRRHDSGWTNTMLLPAAPPAGDVRQYQYPYSPLHGAMFRVRDGEFTAADLGNGAFAEFADAKSLWLHNSHIVGHELANAMPGDLLFFRQSAGQTGHGLPFHAMIFLGNSRVEPGREQYVLYHTGPRNDSPGEIRRLSLAELRNYPDARWRPVPSNPAFLGVYRWNILRGDD